MPQPQAAAPLHLQHASAAAAAACLGSQVLGGLWGDALRGPHQGLRLPSADLLAAAGEETDHLAWCADRLHELDSRPSLLNPLWYAGSWAIGAAAGLRGDGWNLGFVVETERQVEAHLASHMDRLPSGDTASRAIVAQMKEDEARHADDALHRGGAPLPAPVRGLMRLAARVMTTVAHRI